MTYETIRLDREGPLATLTIDRPEVRNAINRRMVDEMHDALEILEADDDLRALVVTAAGGRAFMSGADIGELRDRRKDDALEGINARLFGRVEIFPRPTVAAIVGWCLGGGCELALACDFRVAGASSRFGQPEVGLGIMAAAGATRRLPALVGLAQARRLLFTGEIIGAEEAKAIGLVDRVVPDELVLDAAHDLLEPVLRQAPEAVRHTKASILGWLHGGHEHHLRKQEDESQAVLFEHPDKFVRMDAFLAKRARKGQDDR